jgi:hypothetical protein
MTIATVLSQENLLRLKDFDRPALLKDLGLGFGTLELRIMA